MADDDAHIRRLWPMDLAVFRRHLERLDDEARFSRFGRVVSDEFIGSYVETSWRLGTLVFGAFAAGDMRGSAELRMLPGTYPPAAEGALAIEPEWQNHGLGQRLMARLVEAARNHGPLSLYMICLRGNARMRHIASKGGARLAFDSGEVSGRLDPGEPTPSSLIGEAMTATGDFVAAVLEWPLLAAKPGQPRR